jgi:hypothetical protein
MDTRIVPRADARRPPWGPFFAHPTRETWRGILLVCGVLSSLYYVAMNLYVPTQWEGYSLLSHVISELSAIDTPTKGLWNQAMVAYTVLLIAFGVGVWMSAGGSRALRIVGALIVGQAVVGAFWPPMHLPGVETTLTDTLHLVWSAAWLLTMLIAMGLAARALGRRFRRYTVATIAVFLVFGTMTGLEAPRVAAALPAPWIGLWERINIAAAMLWMAVLAVVLLRRGSPVGTGGPVDASS